MKHLAINLRESEEKLKRQVAKLEQMSGYKSVDVAFLANNEAVLRSKISSLGLDPSDTTAQELYYSLLVKVEADIAHLLRAWDINDLNAGARLIEIAAANLDGRQVMALKNTAAKDILRLWPPKKTMKALNYRSLESMLKREDIPALISLAMALEPSSWRAKFTAKVAHCSVSSFEFRQVRLAKAPAALPLHRLVVSQPLGATIFVEDKISASDIALAILQIFEAEEVMQSQSHYLSTNQFSPKFSALAAGLITNSEAPNINIADQNFANWRQAKQALSKDLAPEQRLCQLHPALNWWSDIGHIGLIKDGPVSMHIGDVLKSFSQSLDYGDRALTSLAHCAKTRLLGSYCQHKAVKNYIEQQIDGTLMTLDTAAIGQVEPAYEMAQT